MTKAVQVLIDREGCEPGTALIYCALDERLDGRLGRDSGLVFIETYEGVTVYASSALAAVCKLARKLGVEATEVTTLLVTWGFFMP